MKPVMGKDSEVSEKRFSTLSFGELLNHSPHIDWVVKDIIPPGTNNILTGDSGLGKSWLALYLAICIATGNDFFHFPVRQGPVLIVDEESAQQLLITRINQIATGMGLDDDIPIQFMISQGMKFVPVADVYEAAENENWIALYRLISDLKPALVIFDSLARLHWQNENSSQEMAQVFASVKMLTDHTKTTSLFLHHTNKTGGYRGSTDIKAFCDTMLSMDKRGDKLAIEHTKSRWAEPIKPFAITFEGDEESFNIRYEGDAPNKAGKKSKREVWEWLQETLGDKSMSRQELIKLVVHQDICSERTLEKVFKYNLEKGNLEAEIINRHKHYRLNGSTLKQLQMDEEYEKFFNL